VWNSKFCIKCGILVIIISTFILVSGCIEITFDSNNSNADKQYNFTPNITITPIIIKTPSITNVQRPYQQVKYIPSQPQPIPSKPITIESIPPAIQAYKKAQIDGDLAYPNQSLRQLFPNITHQPAITNQPIIISHPVGTPPPIILPTPTILNNTATPYHYLINQPPRICYWHNIPINIPLYSSGDKVIINNTIYNFHIYNETFCILSP
jgi:hypothetical protein